MKQPQYEEFKYNQLSEAIAFVENGGSLFTLDSGHAYNLSLGEVWATAFGRGKLFKEKEPTPWYEDIPEGGVLCWVWDEDKNGTSLECVTKYMDNNFLTCGVYETVWDNAQPLTVEELRQFVARHKDLGF